MRVQPEGVGIIAMKIVVANTILPNECVTKVNGMRS